MMLSKRILLIMTSLALTVTGCRQKEEVDLILKNAKIYTVNNSFSVVQGAAIRNGKFVAVASDATISARYTSDSVLDLKGKFVYPGFIDSHAHFMQYALSLAQVDLDEAESINSVLNKLLDFKKKHEGQWIVARNLAYTSSDDCVIPDNTILNRQFEDTPVFIWTKDYKTALVNDALLKAVGLKYKGNGYLTNDQARNVSKQLPEPTRDELAELIKRAERDCFNVGITSTTDFGATCSNLELIDSLHKAGILQIPVYAILEPSAENMARYISKMPVQTDKLKVVSVGVDIDGRLSQHNAVMLAPYTDLNVNGQLRVSPDSLKRLCKTAFDNGFQMCVGCVGDSAARLALETYARILPHKNNMRWRIENLHLITRRDMKYFSHFNVIPSVQPTQYELNKSFMTDNITRKLKKEVFAWKQMLGQNQGIVSGSNAPYGPLKPTEIMYAAMSQKKRKTHNKQSQKMTPTQTLKSLTIWAAYSQFDEQQKGSIEVGKWADFVVVGKNITTMYQPDLPQVEIEQTYLRGKRVK
ncbi:MAG: amidohydrolase family protein [Salinivirgaceae bacterium]|nr:amidohydrolase family protein [Salinivirgaceae bacterium]